MKFPSVVYLALCFLLVAQVAVYAQADEHIDDPLKNPAVWQQILKDHENRALWEKYMGKSWGMMSEEEKKRVFKWQKFVAIEIIAQREAIYGQGFNEEVNATSHENDPDFWGNKQKEAAERNTAELAREEEARKNVYFKRMEEMMVQEPTVLAELMMNIQGNFMVIEDILDEEYEALGEQYRFYEDVHPDGKYSQERWVQERSEELKYFKKRDFERRKSQLASASTF